MDEEKELLDVIDQRDAAENAMSEAYTIVTGKQVQWSNHFGYKEALEEIEIVVEKQVPASET